MYKRFRLREKTHVTANDTLFSDEVVIMHGQVSVSWWVSWTVYPWRQRPIDQWRHGQVQAHWVLRHAQTQSNKPFIPFLNSQIMTTQVKNDIDSDRKNCRGNSQYATMTNRQTCRVKKAWTVPPLVPLVMMPISHHHQAQPMMNNRAARRDERKRKRKCPKI